MSTMSTATLGLFLTILITISECTYIDQVVSKPDEFGYSAHNGPLTWGLRFSGCRGERQSPISLEESECTQEFNSELPPLRWHSDIEPTHMPLEMKNTWHSVEVTFRDRTNRPELRGGPLEGSYVMAQVHFHWASEHFMNHRPYGLEAHMVHYKTEYETIERASQQKDGLAVVALLLKEGHGRTSNRGLDELVSSLRHVRQGNSSCEVSPSSLAWLWRLDLFTQYFTYRGSLTTPPCTENVAWIVARQHSHVGAKQVLEFRKLQGHDGPIVENNRPLQLRNNRQVICFAEREKENLYFPNDDD